MFRLLATLLALHTATATAGGPVPEPVKAALRALLPGVSVENVAPAPASGLYEVAVGANVYYVTADGQHLIDGNMIDVDTRANLTEQRRGELRLDLIGQVNTEDMIVFAPPRPERTITVFTDVDCPYCAKFHRDVPELVESGLKVRYLLFPRAGLDSSTYEKSVAVWCAEDRKKAIGMAKAGDELEARQCENPVADHYRLGRRVGVRGTPTIMLDDGRMLTGYVPPAKLRRLLGLGEGAAGVAAKP